MGDFHMLCALKDSKAIGVSVHGEWEGTVYSGEMSVDQFAEKFCENLTVH
jgi:hypothetical protein